MTEYLMSHTSNLFDILKGGVHQKPLATLSPSYSVSENTHYHLVQPGTSCIQLCGFTTVLCVCTKTGKQNPSYIFFIKMHSPYSVLYISIIVELGEQKQKPFSLPQFTINEF